MKQRFAEIVTKFSSEGLAELRRELRDLGTDAQSMDHFSSRIRDSADHFRAARAEAQGLNSDLRETSGHADRLKTSSNGLHTHFAAAATELKKARTEAQGLHGDLTRLHAPVQTLGTHLRSLDTHFHSLRTAARGLHTDFSAMPASLANLSNVFRNAGTDAHRLRSETQGLRTDLQSIAGAGSAISTSLAQVTGHLQRARTEARGLRQELVKAGRTASLIGRGFRTTATDIAAVRTAAANLATDFTRMAGALPGLTTRLDALNQVLRRTAFHLRTSRIEAGRLNLELGRAGGASRAFSDNMRRAGVAIRGARQQARGLRGEISSLGPVFGKLHGGLRTTSSLLGRLGLDRGLFGGLIRGAQSAATGIVGAFTGAAAKVAGLAFSPLGLIGGAAGLAGYGAVKFSPLVTGGAALAGGALAGVFTSMDLKQIKEFAEAVNITTESAQQWREWGNSVSLAGSDVAAAFIRLQQAQVQSIDPDSDISKVFRAMVIAAADASGNIADTQTVMLAFADKLQGLNQAQRSFALTTILGDPSKYNSFLKTISEDREKLLATYNKNRADQLFATPDQMEAVLSFRTALQDIFLIFRAITREVYIAFLPVFEKFTANLEATFRNPAKRAQIVESWFVKPFERGLKLAEDMSAVFAGFDLGNFLFGQSSTAVENTWLFRLKAVVLDIWDVSRGLGRLFLGVGRAIVSATQALERFVQVETGVSLFDWLDKDGPQKIGAFFSDMGQIIGNIFSEALNSSSLSTPLARWLNGHVETFKSQFLGFASSIHQSFAELRASWTSSQGIDGASTTLGKVLILIDQTIRSFVDLAAAVKNVFFDGEAAPKGFEWLNQVKTTVDYIIEGFKQVWGILSPILSAANELTKSTTGMNLLATTVLAKLGVEAGTTALKAAPVVAGAAALGGGAAVGAKIGDFLGKLFFRQDPAVDAEQAKNSDKDFAAKGGPKTASQAESYNRNLAIREGRDPSEARGFGDVANTSRNIDFIESSKRMDAEIAKMDAASAAAKGKPGDVTGPLGSVNVTATGTPVVINIDGKRSTGIYPADQADALQRDMNAALGGR